MEIENVSDGIQIRLVDETIPPGMRRRRFVVAGCGDPTCDACYEPIPEPLSMADALSLRAQQEVRAFELGDGALIDP